MSDSSLPPVSIDEPLRKRFEAAWVEGRPRPIEHFLPGQDDERYLSTLEELVHIELEFAWKSRAPGPQEENATAAASPIAAEPPRVESYLSRFPLLNQPEIVLRLVQQECYVRRQAGEPATLDEYNKRFPKLVVSAARFESLLRTVGLGQPDVSSAGDCPDFPAGKMGLSPSQTRAVGQGAGDWTPRTLPRQFGGYELLEEIGRGGMGVVYRARQSGADRIVALKVVRRDLAESLPPDTQTSALDRFRHEAQAAARLDHENLVTVYEVGDVDGEPFFSMRYVEGPSLAQMLPDGPIPNRRAAAYIEPVARAVDQAHAHGILHRDLKPSNILVDSSTDRPMVADFGLAKLLENQEELTHSGDVMGSPPYMSPEQARDSSRVTAQTDVYALGATLYHILTGRPPFHAATMLETLQQVVEEEPVAPRQLNPAIDLDLETICLKCLQKEPSQRYDSAASLADDLARYLAGAPIQARPIGPVQRALRWCRRNPTTATLIGSTLTFLILALVAAVVGYVKTSSALRAAETSYRHARETVDDFFTRVSEDTLLNTPGMQPLRRELLQQALDYYQSFLSRQGEDPALQDELALTHFRVGRIVEQIDSPEAALASYRDAVKVQERLLAQRPNDRQRLEALGNTLNAVGGVLFRQGDWDKARTIHQEAAGIRARLVDAGPDDHTSQRKLANSYMNIALVDQKQGHGVDAQSQFEKAQTIRSEVLAKDPDCPETRRDLAMGYYNLAVLALWRDTPRYAAAQASFERSVGIFEELLRENPEDLANQYRLAVCCRLLADVKCVREDWDSALQWYGRALARMEKLARSNPDVPEYRAALAGLHMNLGALERQERGDEAALDSLQRAVAILEELVDGHSSVARYRRDLAVTLREVAACRSSGGEHEAARKALAAAQSHLGTLVAEFSDNPEYRTLLDETADTLAEQQDAAKPKE